jgi:hypothetical protein
MSSQASAQIPIPYRAETAVSGGELTGVLTATILVLAAFLVLALYARKRGWLRKLAPLAAAGQTGKRWRPDVQAQRISRLTTVYRIEDGTNAWLVVESTGQVSVSVLTNEPASGESIDATP